MKESLEGAKPARADQVDEEQQFDARAVEENLRNEITRLERAHEKLTIALNGLREGYDKALSAFGSGSASVDKIAQQKYELVIAEYRGLAEDIDTFAQKIAQTRAELDAHIDHMDDFGIDRKGPTIH